MIYVTIMIAVAILVSVCIRAWHAFFKVRKNFLKEFNRAFVTNSPKTWLIGGMMGSGKTTFANRLAVNLGLKHIEIDRYTAENEILANEILAAVRAAEKTGWVAEANPWQIPQSVYDNADVIIFLDYDNSVNYIRLLIRGYKEWCSQNYSWSGFRESIVHRAIMDLGRIVYLYGKENRKGWREGGLFAGIDVSQQGVTYVRCISPAELNRLERFVLDSWFSAKRR